MTDEKERKVRKKQILDRLLTLRLKIINSQLE